MTMPMLESKKLLKKPLPIPQGVSVNVHPEYLEIKGKKEIVKFSLHQNIEIFSEGGFLKLNVNFGQINQANKARTIKTVRKLKVLVGTTWAHLKNTLIGVSEGFKTKLELVGVGYRAQAQGNKLSLSLGYSHPVVYELMKGVTAETPSQTEIILSSFDKQLLGQVAAEIQAYRMPECYKGKGIKFAGQIIVLKETKKK